MLPRSTAATRAILLSALTASLQDAAEAESAKHSRRFSARCRFPVRPFEDEGRVAGPPATAPIYRFSPWID
jgi:hypothetical protein